MKVGVILLLFGMLMMVVSLANKSIGLIPKTFLFLFSLGIVILGVLVETPVLEHWKTSPGTQGEMSKKIN